MKRKTRYGISIGLTAAAAALIFFSFGFGVFGDGFLPGADEVRAFLTDRQDRTDRGSDAAGDGAIAENQTGAGIPAGSRNRVVTPGVVSGQAAAVSGPAVEEVPEEPVPETKSITISAVGDCSLGKLQIHGYSGSFLSYYDKYGPDYFFKNVKQYFSSDDLTLANLEGVLSTSDQKVEKKYNIEGPPEYTSILTAAGIDLVGTGNNHIMDYGKQGAEDTWAALDAAGIPYAYESKTALFTAENGLKVGVVAAMCFNMGSDKEAAVKKSMDALRSQGADLIVFMCHWGIEGNYTPEAGQVDFAHRIIDDGADLFVGAHPHVLQGLEEYHGKMILYSEGNFCFGGNRNPDDKDTMIYQQTFTFTDGVLQDGIDAKVIPCRLSSRKDTNDFCPTPLSGSEGQAVLDKLNQISSGLGEEAVSLQADGRVQAESRQTADNAGEETTENVQQ